MRPWARSTATRWPPSSSATCAAAAPGSGASSRARVLRLPQAFVVRAGGAAEGGEFGIHLGQQLRGGFADGKFTDRGGHHRFDPPEPTHPARAEDTAFAPLDALDERGRAFVDRRGLVRWPGQAGEQLAE